MTDCNYLRDEGGERFLGRGTVLGPESVRDERQGESYFAKEILGMNPFSCLPHHLKVGTGVV